MTETPDENSDDKRIVQIIPADGWVAVYQDTPNLRMPLAAWGLRSDGQVVPLAAYDDGDVQDPRTVENFAGIERADRVDAR